MKIWTTPVSPDIISSIADQLKDLSDALFFDIETTGLSPKYHFCYLIGCCFFDGNTWQIQQFFCEKPEDEPDMLQAFYDFCSTYTTMISFNGCHFDLPFLDKRAKHYHIDTNLTKLHQIDIYREVQPLKKILSLPSCRQKSIEEFLGIFREDQYDGGQLIPVYDSYTKNADPEALHLLKLHNYEDVQGMLLLLPILSYKKIKDGLKITHISQPEETIDYLGNPSADLCLSGDLSEKLPKPIRINCDEMYCIFEEDHFRLSIHLYQGDLRYYIKDYKKYDYLIQEKRIVPKSLSKYVDKSQKEPATPQNCYLIQNGCFLALPHKYPYAQDVHHFCKDSSDKQEYMLYNEAICDAAFWAQYVTYLLEQIIR